MIFFVHMIKMVNHHQPVVLGVVAAAVRGHLVHVLAPVVQGVQILESRLPIEILEVPLASHVRSTKQTGMWFSRLALFDRLTNLSATVVFQRMEAQ